MTKLRVLSLFAGIGGFDLGLERTNGFETVAFCEINPFCRRVLAKNWPDVPCYEDVRILTADALSRDGIAVDVICGGFPCQDVSVAGKRAGLAGERSGLWSEYRRLIGELRPRFVLIENVPGLLSAGARDVVGDLAALGFDCLWECIPASSVGAPHRRDRFWLIAHTSDYRHGQHVQQVGQRRGRKQTDIGSNGQVQPVADAHRIRPHGAWPLSAGRGEPSHGGWWTIEPDVGRVVARVSSWMDGGRLDNADDFEGGTRKILRALRCSDDAGTLQWASGGFRGIQAAQVLFANVCEYQGPPRTLGDVSLAGSEASQDAMRGLWFDGQAACASCRRNAGEQRGKQHPDAMCLVSQLFACDCRSTWLDTAGASGSVRRAERIRALGNAVVPQVPEIIGRAILRAIA